MAPRGPLVRRTAHRGSILYVVAVVQFVAAMAIVQWRYSGYSDLANAISDLGNYAQSAWAAAYNLSLVSLGVVGLAGTALIRSAFPSRRTSRIGIGLLFAAFAGAIGIGIFAEGAPYGLHTLLSFLTFLLGGVALVVLSIAMLRDTRWVGVRLFTLLCGVVSLGALVALASAGARLSTMGLYGGVERIVVGPLLLWAVVAGLHLLRIPIYEPERAAVVDVL